MPVKARSPRPRAEGPCERPNPPAGDLRQKGNVPVARPRQIGYNNRSVKSRGDNGSTDMKRWLCKECGYIHEGDEPPEICPQCYAPREAFEEVANA